MVGSLKIERNEEKSLMYSHAGDNQSLIFYFMCSGVCDDSKVLTQKHSEAQQVLFIVFL